MGRLSLKNKVPIMVSLALVFAWSAAEREYFHHPSDLTWEDARNHCQTCFKDLVTLTPENIQNISKLLTSDCWIGLRKNSNSNSTMDPTMDPTMNSTMNSPMDPTMDPTMNSTMNSTMDPTMNSTMNSTMRWFRWTNGDPLIFQNWYPGWPVFRSSLPNRYYFVCQEKPSLETTTLKIVPPPTGTPGSAFPPTGTQESAAPATGNTESAFSATGNTESAFSATGTPGWIAPATGTPGLTAPATGTPGSAAPTTGTPGSAAPTTGTLGLATENSTSNSTEFDATATAATTAAATPALPARCKITQWPEEAHYVLLPDFLKTDENYIEDSCVAMLSFGPWVEKECSERLPSICYEDRFFGEVNVTDKTFDSANLAWRKGPGNIAHYRVEVRYDNVLTQKHSTEDLTYNLTNLTSGTRYSVQVFAVKCSRDLNPQEETFYTTPQKVENLKFTNVTETSVLLNWTKPAGNLDFYLIGIQNGTQIRSKTEGKIISGLIPGNLYTFTVVSGVVDKSTWSEKTQISLYTKPGRVLELKVSHYTHHSLQLNWKQPEGNAPSYRVININENKTFFTSKTEQNITDLPIGSRITFSVTVVVNGTIEGDSVTIDGNTAPGPITNLTLITTDRTLNASWLSEGNSVSFTVELLLENTMIERRINKTEIFFPNLKTAANYTVTVYTFNRHHNGQSLTKSIFTRPSPPTNLTVKIAGKRSITFEWDPPADVAGVTYTVKINSIFWGDTQSATVDNKNSYTFSGLNSGTKYYFEVQTKAGTELSEKKTLSQLTVAEEREISLSMMCSSSQPLLCDGNATRESVFNKLKTHFDNVLGDNIFWRLEKLDPQNK